MRAFDKSSLLEYRRIAVQRSTAPVANSFQKWIEGLKVTVFSKTYCSEYATRSTRSAILTILRLSCHRGLSFRHAELNCLQQLVAQCDKMHSTQNVNRWANLSGSSRTVPNEDTYYNCNLDIKSLSPPFTNFGLFLLKSFQKA